MHKLFAPIATAAVVMLVAAPAHAEKWLWFPIRGGAVAFDDDSRQSDLTAGTTAANTVIYYDTPKSVGDLKYRFVAERLEFECRGARHRWSQSAILDAEGAVLTARDDGLWTPLGPEMGSTSLFKRMLCMAQLPPGQKQAKDFDTLLVAVKSASPTAPAATSTSKPPASAAPKVEPNKAIPSPATKAAVSATPATKAPDVKTPTTKAPAPAATPPVRLRPLTQ